MALHLVLGIEVKIGRSAYCMSETVIGGNCITSANALVLENQNNPCGAFVIGSPGKITVEL